MSRHEEPNASHFSARYAERKMAERRVRLAQPAKDRQCLHCGATVPSIEMKTMCAPCLEEHRRIARASGIDAADEWVRCGIYYRSLIGGGAEVSRVTGLRVEEVEAIHVSRSGTPTTPNAKRTRPMVTLTLSHEALARLDAIAAERGQSRSGAVEALVRNARLRTTDER